MAPHPIVLTVDVEADWGGQAAAAIRGVEEVLPELLGRLARAGARATLFVVGELAGPVREALAGAGGDIEVGSHSMTHAVLTRIPADRVAWEVAASKAALEDAGFAVRGFRAPFLSAPRGLADQLAAAGYEYDSSGGSVVPSPANFWRARRRERGAVARVPPSTLRDRVTPFSLTWLRLYGALGLRLVPRGPAVFYCHLHEFLDSREGLASLPWPLRRLHARNTGAGAWRILDTLLASGRPVIGCADWLAGAREVG